MEVTMTKLEQSSPSQICRLCATIGIQFIPIFNGEGAEHQLCEKIHKHLPIHVRSLFICLILQSNQF